MTKIVGDIPMRVTPGTCRKLDLSLGWQEGTSWHLCDEEPPADSDLESDLVRLISEAQAILDRLREREGQEGRVMDPALLA